MTSKTLDDGRCSHLLLARISASQVQDTEAGCCGIAGSFGDEVEYSSLSQTIAEQRLLPSLSEAAVSTQRVSNGLSCRHQIADLSGRKSLHIAEVLRSFL